ncbi:condensation domain-containing protein, partial [Photorhabdus thracensis]
MPMLLSNTQERFFFEWKLTPNSPAFNTPLVFKIQGNINVSALNSALASVVKRHNTLRTVFIEVNDKVFQKILDDLVPEMELVDLTDIPSYKQNEVKIDTINKIISK